MSPSSPVPSAFHLPAWRDYLAFHLKLGQDFWYDRIEDLPYGRLLVGASTFLFCGDLRTARFEDILSRCQNVAARCAARLSFFFSPETAGDQIGFREYLKENGYRRESAVEWMVLDPVSVLTFPCPQIRRAQAVDTDVEALGRIYDGAFGDDPSGRQPFLNLVLKPRTVVREHVFLIADGETGEDVGMVACAFDDRFGYVHDLAVLPGFRQKGVGRLLMSHVLSVLADADVRSVVSAAAVENTASMELHKRRGYRRFAYTESWGI